MGIFPALCIGLLLHQLDGAKAQAPFGGEERLEGMLAPRSNVVMQSVVLGRRQPSFLPPPVPVPVPVPAREGPCEPPPGLNVAQLVRYLLRTVLPLPYKDEGGSRDTRDSDAELIDPDRLEKIINAAMNMKDLRRDKEDEGESTEIERLVEIDSDREKPRKLMRDRDEHRRRGGSWKRHRGDEEEDDVFTRRRSPRREEDEAGRRWRKRRTYRRRNHSWEDTDEDRLKKVSDEERQKKTFEAEWEPSRSWSKKNHEGRETIYLPPPYPQIRHLLRPRSDDYIRRTDDGAVPP